MQIARILQAVALMLIVALAASCAATKEYTSKIFPVKTEVKDSQEVALRFLELDKLDPDPENWVSTDIIMGRDTGNKTAALDKLSQVFPATGITHPTENVPQAETQTTPVYVNTAPASTDKNAATKTENKNVRKRVAASTKTAAVKEEKSQPIVVTEKKTEPVVEEPAPVARTYNTGDSREKRSREEK